MVKRYHWPKVFPPLTPQQVEIADDWMRHWHEVLPNRYGVIEKFNHGYPLKHLPAHTPFRTIELGAGTGGHLEYEDLSIQEYHCIELRENMASEIRRRFPSVTATVADCQQRLPYPDAHFDRAVVVHVFEHLPNLPGAVAELARVLKPGAIFSLVIPCDPGIAYEIARQVSSARIFRKRYHRPYMWLMRREHINSPREILWVVKGKMQEIHRSYFPIGIPIMHANLCVGLTFTTPGGVRQG
jgi:phosphatidylethanolamine/phosphatidyl-N-methylethanolamine N-methyltransferase